MCYEIILEPCPLQRPPILFKRRRIKRPPETDPQRLEALHRAYLSGVADGLQACEPYETLYPHDTAGRYALGYSLGRAWRPL